MTDYVQADCLIAGGVYVQVNRGERVYLGLQGPTGKRSGAELSISTEEWEHLCDIAIRWREVNASRDHLSRDAKPPTNPSVGPETS